MLGIYHATAAQPGKDMWFESAIVTAIQFMLRSADQTGLMPYFVPDIQRFEQDVPLTQQRIEAKGYLWSPVHSNNPEMGVWDAH